MANRLKAYTRRTMLAAARDYAPGNRRTPDSTRAAFSDALRGTDSGWWSDLIYTAPMLQMARRYRSDIAAALAEYRDETGESYTYRERSSGMEINAESILAALMHPRAFTLSDYQSEREGGPADAALLGLRFAVEWYAGQIASELCPDL